MQKFELVSEYGPAGDQPKAIAEELWHLANQDRSAWSFNVEVRPFRETW